MKRALITGALLLAGCSFPGADRLRPTAAVVEGYAVQWSHPGVPIELLAIDADGRACEAFGASDYLTRACVLTTNIDVRFIAGEAFGRPVVEPDHVFEAITWRAVLNSDPSACEIEGVLVVELLGLCRAAVDAGARQVTRDDIVVIVSSPD